MIAEGEVVRVDKRRALRILCVENEQEACEAIERLLKAEGHHVSIARDITAAIAVIVSDEPFDLLIIDAGMPNGAGLDLVRSAQSTPGIIVTAHGMRTNASHDLRAGFVEHLYKPIDPAALKRAIARAMEHRKSSAPTKNQETRKQGPTP
jgi:two-component system, chemotaxis family, CheB/CheR fusion protein